MKHLLLFKAWLLFLFWVLPVEIHSATTMEDTNFSYSYCIGGVQITKFHGSYNEYRTITIPKTFRGQKVVKIGNFAFQNASFARVVRIPKFVKEIGFRAFYALSDLEEIKFYDANYYGSEAYKTELKYVGGECFMNCYKLRGFTADKVDSIAEHAFSGCLDLKKIDIKEGSIIGSHAFYECYSLENLFLGDSFETIGENAFAKCLSLKNFSIPASVKQIRKNTFDGCEKLSLLVFRDGMDDVQVDESVTDGKNEGIFTSCPLDSVYIGRNIKSLGLSPFYRNQHIKSIEFGNSVTQVPQHLFEENEEIISVKAPWKLPNVVDESVFSYTTFMDATLVVPLGTKSIYKSVHSWSDFQHIDDGSRLPQSIVWKVETTSWTIGDELVLNASSDSNLKVDYKIKIGGECARIIKLDGVEKLCFIKAGQVEVEAFQSGNSVYSSATPISITFEVLRKKQSIKWNTNTKVLVDSTLELTAEASSGLPISYEIIEGSKYAQIKKYHNAFLLKGVCAGKVLVTANQAGDDSFSEATSVTMSFEVVDDNVTIRAKSYTRIYGEQNPKLEFVTDGAVLDGIPEITCSADVDSPVGSYIIEVRQGTVKNSKVHLENGTLQITKAPLTITADNYTITQGDKLPEFTANYSGFKNGEDESVLTKQPVFSCDANEASAPGEYPINVYGVEADNYNAISYVAGTLTVLKRELKKQTITWGQEIKAKVGSTIEMNATASSGLPVRYSYALVPRVETAYQVPQIEGNKITFSQNGMYLLVAIQAGNNEYAAATDTLDVCAISDDEGLMYIDGIYYKYTDDGSALKVVRGYNPYRGKVEIPATVNGLPVTEVDGLAMYACYYLKELIIGDNVKKCGHEALGASRNLQKVTLPANQAELRQQYVFNCDDGIKEIHCRSSVPYLADESLFNGFVNYDNCILYVPVGTKQSYANAEVWKYFTHIVEENVSTSISNINVEKKSVWYTLQGVKLFVKPNIPGVYIHNGKKIIVR